MSKLNASHCIGICFSCVVILFSVSVSGCRAPDFQLLSGENKRLSDYQGRYLLVNYWAKWCKPCLEEMPDLNHFAQKYADDYSVLGVSFDRLPAEQLLKVVNDYDLKYDMARSDPAPKLPFEMPAMLPANYVVKPDGSWHGPVYGKQTAESALALILTLKNGELDD